MLLATMRYNNFFTSLNESVFRNDFQNNILTCSYQGNPCNLSTDFAYFFNSDYSYCFKYNSDFSNLKTTIMPGASNGFEFSFYLGSDNATNVAFENKRGLRVFIHNSTRKYPIKYVDIQPGVQASISLTQTQYQHLSAPYTNCISDVSSNTEPKSPTMQYMFANLSVFTYSYMTCQEVLFNINLLQNCNCTSQTFLSGEVNKLCYTPKDIECLNKFRRDYDADISSVCPLGKIYLLFFINLRCDFHP